jgi:hypothetical protein
MRVFGQKRHFLVKGSFLAAHEKAGPVLNYRDTGICQEESLHGVGIPWNKALVYSCLAMFFSRIFCDLCRSMRSVGKFSATRAGVESVFQAGFELPTMIELFRGGKQGG